MADNANCIITPQVEKADELFAGERLEQYIEARLPPKSKFNGEKREAAKQEIREYYGKFTEGEILQESARSAEQTEAWLENAKKVGEQLKEFGERFAKNRASRKQSTRRRSVISMRPRIRARARSYARSGANTATTQDDSDGGDSDSSDPPAKTHYSHLNLIPKIKQLNSFSVSVAFPRLVSRGILQTLALGKGAA